MIIIDSKPVGRESNLLKEYISDPKSFNDSLLRITSDRKQYERYIYMYTKPLLLIL